MAEYIYDDELLAMNATLKAVKDLSSDQRKRVLDWVSIRAGEAEAPDTKTEILQVAA